jgi:hypothetical protein
MSQSRLPGEEGAHGVKNNREADVMLLRRKEVAGAGVVAAGDLDPLDELLEALVVDEGGLPFGDDGGIVLARELHHPQPPIPPAATLRYMCTTVVHSGLACSPS